jgi:hydroxyacylglutathione hydrolase
MILRPFLYDPTACASYLFGCLTYNQLAVVDPHVELADRYLEAAEAAGAPIVAVFETHVQADHVSGLPALVAATGATAYLPAGARVDFDHHALEDGERVELGNTIVTALATPGHAPAHHAYLVADLRRETAEPWLAFTGDSLLVNDAGRPDLHAAGGDPRDLALLQHASMVRLLELPDHVVILPSHYGGSVCGRGLSGNPISSVGFERLHNRALVPMEAEAFADDLLRDLPGAPPEQERIVAANRSGVPA